jgi:hypothetical protein
MTDKVFTTIHITVQQHDSLQRLREKTKVPTAVRIRDAIDRLLADEWKREQLEMVSPLNPAGTRP